MTINKFIKENKDNPEMEDIGVCVQRCYDQNFSKKEVKNYYKRLLKSKGVRFSGMGVLAKSLIFSKIEEIYSKKA